MVRENSLRQGQTRSWVPGCDAPQKFVSLLEKQEVNNQAENDLKRATIFKATLFNLSPQSGLMVARREKLRQSHVLIQP